MPAMVQVEGDLVTVLGDITSQDAHGLRGHDAGDCSPEERRRCRRRRFGAAARNASVLLTQQAVVLLPPGAFEARRAFARNKHLYPAVQLLADPAVDDWHTQR